MFFKKDVLKICRNFTGEHSSLSVISIKLIVGVAVEHNLKNVASRKVLPSGKLNWYLVLRLQFAPQINGLVSI